MAESAMPQRAHARPVNQPLYGAAADEIRDQLRKPSALDTAIRVAQDILATYGDSRIDGFTYPAAYGAVTESLRILLRALGAEPDEREAVRRSVDAQFPVVAAFLANERGERQ